MPYNSLSLVSERLQQLTRTEIYKSSDHDAPLFHPHRGDHLRRRSYFNNQKKFHVSITPSLHNYSTLVHNSKRTKENYYMEVLHSLQAILYTASSFLNSSGPTGSSNKLLMQKCYVIILLNITARVHQGGGAE